MAVNAVVFDLFGTLVVAPTADDRAVAASRLSSVSGRDAAMIERYLRDTWAIRHDGRLPTVRELATHLVRAIHATASAIDTVAAELYALGRSRLVTAASVLRSLRLLHDAGIRLGVLSDASAEIATAWQAGPLAAVVDAAVFSCWAGALKPDQRLYACLLSTMGVRAREALYVGDGGGDELRGALTAGMVAVGVRRRGPAGTLAFGETDWLGPMLDTVENVPSYLAEQA